MPLASILPSYAMHTVFKKKNVAGCYVIYELPPVVFLLVKIFCNKIVCLLAF